MARIYAQRIDWLLSGDDGENDLHRRILKEVKENNLEELYNKVQHTPVITQLYVARDKSDRLWLYRYCPQKLESTWSGGYPIKELDKDNFPEVKWSDEYPTEINVELLKQ